MEAFEGRFPAGLPEIDFICSLSAQKIEPSVVGYSEPEFHWKMDACVPLVMTSALVEWVSLMKSGGFCQCIRERETTKARGGQEAKRVCAVTGDW